MTFSRAMRPVTNQWRTPVLQGVEIDRFLVGRSIRPTPQEDTEPLKRERSDSGLM
jgi:hypothetical protein